MKNNMPFVLLFLIFTGFLGSAVAIDWGFIDPKYWTGILIILLWAVIGSASYTFLSNHDNNRF